MDKSFPPTQEKNPSRMCVVMCLPEYFDTQKAENTSYDISACFFTAFKATTMTA